jgi:hypothetical protein
MVAFLTSSADRRYALRHDASSVTRVISRQQRLDIGGDDQVRSEYLILREPLAEGAKHAIGKRVPFMVQEGRGYAGQRSAVIRHGRLYGRLFGQRSRRTHP